MYRNYLTLIPVVSILIFSTATAHAVEVGDVAPRADRWSQQAETWRQKFTKEERQKICNAVQERVNERWTKYYDRRTRRVENMGKGAVILEKRIAFYKSKGLETSALEADLKTLKPMIDEYKTEYLKFLDLLEAAKTLPCANYQGEFLPKLKAAKDQWIVVKQKSDSVRDFYRETVKKHLQELAKRMEHSAEE